MTSHEEVLREIEALAEDNKWPIIGPAKGQVLAEVLQKYHPVRVLEVGTLVGYSAILMSQFLPKDAMITTLEINPNIAEIARENFAKAGISGSVDLRVGDALDLIPSLRGPFDLVFLDAAKEHYLQYLKLAEPKMTHRAIVIADNVKIFAYQMRNFLDYVRDGSVYESKTHDFGFDAVEVCTRK